MLGVNISDFFDIEVRFIAMRHPINRIAKPYIAVVLAVFLLSAGFAGGLRFGVVSATTYDETGARTGVLGRVLGLGRDAPEKVDVEFSRYWEVWNMVRDRHVHRPVDEKKIFYGSLAGMVASLEDPYSVFFDPDFAAEFASELSGTFEGIGAEIGIKKNQLTVIAPLSGTPADRAGLRSGDRILAIDGADTTGLRIEDAVSRIRGPKGTEVKLLVTRDGLLDAQEINIVRDTITVEPVKMRMVEHNSKTIAVITLSQFSESSAVKFREAVRAVLLKDPAGLVLDLRNDPGGFLETAVDVAEQWIPQDIIVVEQFSDGTRREYRSGGGARLTEMPTVVLVNGGSASASEIVAGALQDYGRARIVGAKTFGKGSVQDYVEFEDGSALKLTVALWLTPKGRSIDKEGIAPDVIVEMTPEDVEQERDPQLEAALDLLVPPVPSRVEGSEVEALAPPLVAPAQ